MSSDKGSDLLAVFRWQHRAGDIGDPPARLDQRGGAVEHLDLILQPHLERAGADPPFGVRTSALWTPARDSRSWIGASCRLSRSVAISRPLPCIIAASARVLPPAPAQRSITCSPGFAADNNDARCEPSSCTSMAPLMKSCSA